MEANEVHPLVTLLLERMKSHPEEFEDDYAPDVEFGGDDTESLRGRWQLAIAEIYNHGSDKDEDALRAGMRIIRLDKAHKWALDELLNGEERRAEEKRERDRIKAMQAQQMKQAYANAQKNVAAAQLSSQGYALIGGGGGGGSSIGVSGPGTYTAATNTAPSLRIGNETIDESFLSSIRKKLGI